MDIDSKILSYLGAEMLVPLIDDPSALRDSISGLLVS